MTSRFLRQAGASVLALEVGYLLLIQLAIVLFTPDTAEIDHTEPRSSGAVLLFLSAEAAVAVVVLWSAAVLGLDSFRSRGPRWARIAALGAAAVLQVAVVREAASNALAREGGPDLVINGVMVLLALVAIAACGLGLRGEFGRPRPAS
ncbi:hypothetical protein ACFV0D_40970 [Streptomyces sp. NPDC059556]|uniref:hypothetical protein n=1 Tax=Streptomyces sp. NPDC059556 TaxID=3346863 RepID=UPI00369D77EA